MRELVLHSSLREKRNEKERFCMQEETQGKERGKEMKVIEKQRKMLCSLFLQLFVAWYYCSQLYVI